MKKGLLYALTILLFTCDQFAIDKVDEQKLVDKELEMIDWKDVDQYPSFPACYEIASKEDVRNCFAKEINATIVALWESEQFVTSFPFNETILLSLVITREGHIRINQIDIPEAIQSKVPELETLLVESFQDLPVIQPALKRGQPVRTQLQLPIRIKSE